MVSSILLSSDSTSGFIHLIHYPSSVTLHPAIITFYRGTVVRSGLFASPPQDAAFVPPGLPQPAASGPHRVAGVPRGSAGGAHTLTRKRHRPVRPESSQNPRLRRRGIRPEHTMASRAGSGPGSNRQRLREDDFIVLSAPRLPPLRNIHSPRDRDSGSPNFAGLFPTRRFWSSSSRRAERIRNLDEQTASLDDAEPPRDSAWAGSFRRSSRLRAVEHRRPTFDDRDQTSEGTNSQLRSLLDMTNHINLVTPFYRSAFSPLFRPQNFPYENRRNKRRKLDADRLVPTTQVLRYGKYGQVEPGQLVMDIVSCDGGIFSNKSSYVAENILKDDNSVYCTKGNRCNIVLRHHGGTAFTLRELFIKAPGSMSYSHPVREGMIFVAMDRDDVLDHTAKYQIQYAVTARPRSWYGHDGYAHHLRRGTRHRTSSWHYDDDVMRTRLRSPPLPRAAADDDERRMPQIPPEFAQNLPDFLVTTECSDDECEQDLSQMLERPPNRIGSLPFEDADSDSDSADPFSSDDFVDSNLYPARQHYRCDHERRDVELREAWDAEAKATQEAVRAVGGELLAPHARFFIENKKTKCTIRFEPPVSGRFILIKMWSSHLDPSSNIDIQSIMARGFAGPRYFPAIELA